MIWFIGIVIYLSIGFGVLAFVANDEAWDELEGPFTCISIVGWPLVLGFTVGRILAERRKKGKQ